MCLDLLSGVELSSLEHDPAVHHTGGHLDFDLPRRVQLSKVAVVALLALLLLLLLVLLMLLLPPPPPPPLLLLLLLLTWRAELPKARVTCCRLSAAMPSISMMRSSGESSPEHAPAPSMSREPMYTPVTPSGGGAAPSGARLYVARVMP